MVDSIDRTHDCNTLHSLVVHAKNLSMTFVACMTLMPWWLCISSQPASAQSAWGVTAHAADPNDAQIVATVRDLLVNELRSALAQQAANTQSGAPAAQAQALPAVCEDVSCTRGASQAAGASVAVHMSIHRLGQKLIVSATAVDVASGATRVSQRMDSQRVEELDLVVKRLATALVTGETTDASAELGTITEAEARAPTRRNGRLGFLLGLSTLVPFSGYADRQIGGGFEAGLWFETYDFVIEPKIGVRMDLTDERANFTHVPFEVVGSYLFSRSDTSPLIGLGLGVGYVREEVYVERTTGSILVTRSQDVISDSLAAGTILARAGVLLARTYDVSLLIAVEYALTFADFQERSSEHALRLHLNVILGAS